MFKHYFERIQDIEIYPIISLSIFFLFFLSLLIWVLKVNKKYIQKMKNLPLEGNAPTKVEGDLGSSIYGLNQ
jgi:cytochrome c oxidase cbb3-type subunit IV